MDDIPSPQEEQEPVIPEPQEPQGLQHQHVIVAAVVIVAVLVIATIAFIFLGGNDTTPVPVNDSSNKIDVLKAPPVGATPQERGAYTAQVKELAQEADVLTIGANCTMNPLVLKLSENDTLSIQNNDTVQHVISFEDENFFAVSGGQSRDIDLMNTFGKGVGTYRYRCSDVDRENNAGVLYVVE